MTAPAKPVRIRSEDLKKLVAFADRVAGTLEPLWRYVTLIPASPTLARVTDGCLLVEIPLPWFSVPFGRQPVSLPIDPIKGFLKSVQGELELLIAEAWRFKHEKDTLVLKPKRPVSVPPWPNGEPLGTIPLKRLRTLLDFSSAHLTDADHIRLLLTGRKLYALGASGGILAAAGAPLEREAEVCLVVPYAAARHAVRALDALKGTPLVLELAEGGFFTASDPTGRVGFLCREEVPDPRVIELFAAAARSVWYVGRTELKALLERAVRMEKAGAARTLLRLHTNRIEVVVEYAHGAFSTSEPVSVARNPARQELPVRAELLLRLISRMSGQKLTLRPVRSGMILSDGSSRHVLIEPRYSPRASSAPEGQAQDAWPVSPAR